jgi:Tol biopolymer transport system component
MKDKKIFIAILILVLLVAGGIGIYFSKKEKKETAPTGAPAKEEAKEGRVVIPPITTKETSPEAVTTIKKTEKKVEVFPVEECDPQKLPKMEGKIYLSLLRKGEKTINLYQFDVEKKELKEFLPDAFVVNFSRDGKKITFVRGEPGNSQIFIADSDGKNIQQVTRSKDEENILKTRPVFSPEGKEIVFTKMKMVSDILADEWDTYITDLKGNERFFSSGVMPIFSPDGKYILILKSPGIYLLNLKTNELERVIELRDENNNLILGQVNMMLSLSQDGKKLALSNVDRGEIYLFYITSWEPFRYKLKGIIRATGLWNTFSPDGNYLAVQTADIGEKGELVNPRLSVLETCTLKEVLSFNLKDYEPSEMWVSDWQK